MRAYKKLVLVLGVVLASSCSLDLREDPNAVQPSEVLPSLLLNSIQRQLPSIFNSANSSGAQMTRLINGGGQTYRVAVRPEDFNGLWSTAYAGILTDANDLIQVADEQGFARHAGMARIIQSYTLLLLVDLFGDVPFSEAFQGAANFNPSPDDGRVLYDYVLQTLDKAKVDLTTPTTTANPAGYLNPVAPDIQDQYYGNNYSRWIKFANTLKLKVFLNLRLTESARAQSGINALLAEANSLISSQSENFIWRYGTNISDPDARHPRFTSQYPGGGGDYQSNWLMWHMFYAYDATQTITTGVQPGDPRMRFYFYRQRIQNTSSSNELRCLTETIPDHYPSATPSAIIDNANAGRPPMGSAPTAPTNDPTDPAWTRTFCIPTDRGYWGRDHVDPQGIPPDGQLRTAYGPYPVGGRFDNNSAVGVTQTVGMKGAGMQPIMMRSFVQFMLAEATLTLTITGGSSSEDYYRNGILYSFSDVRDWAVNGTYATSGVAASPTEATTINAFYPAAAYENDVTAYVTSAVASFNDPASEKLNYVAREYWVALVGNGYEAYNLYRRTGRPTGMQPALNPQPGDFPRSFWYPASFATLNNTATQKPDLKVRVFWDMNSTNLDF